MEQANIENIDKAINAWIKSSDDNYDEMLDFLRSTGIIGHFLLAIYVWKNY